MTGDDHSFPVSNAVSEINNVAASAACYLQLWYPFTTSATPVTLGCAGDTMQFISTTLPNLFSGVAAPATWNGMQNVMSTASDFFRNEYPALLIRDDTEPFSVWSATMRRHGRSGSAQAVSEQGIQLTPATLLFPPYAT